MPKTMHDDEQRTPHERTPLLLNGIPREQQHRKVDEDVIDFDFKDDAANPQNWSPSFKWGIVSLLALIAFNVTFTCISVVPLANSIVRDLSPSSPNDDASSSSPPSKSSSILLVTIWELGEAAGPLLIAPLSEEFGRRPVFNLANAVFVLSTVLAACSGSVPTLVAARALTGLAVASNVLGPAIVGDMFAREERGSAMSVVMLAPLVGGAVGPAVGSALAEKLGSWRGVVLLAAAMSAAGTVLFGLCFRETYKVPILRARAERIGPPVHAPVVDGHAGVENGLSRFWEPIARPAAVLWSSGVLMMLSLFGSVVYTTFYVMSVTLPNILEEKYHLSPALSGSTFVCFSLGSLIAVLTCNMTLDRIYIKLRDVNNGAGQPEYRLPLAVVGGFGLPLALSLYGWTAELQLPLWLFLLALGFLGFTVLITFLPLMSYVVDAFGLVSASALTGVIVTRCLMGTFLPLATSPLVGGFGYGWGMTIFAAVCLVLAPIPVFILRYGSYYRQGSQYTRCV